MCSYRPRGLKSEEMIVVNAGAMPPPQSPLSKAEFEFDAVPTPPSSKTRRKHHKKLHGTSSGSEVPFTRKEQLRQLLAVFVIAAVVYHAAIASFGRLTEDRKPFCNEQQEPLQGMQWSPTLPPRFLIVCSFLLSIGILNIQLQLLSVGAVQF